LNESELINRAKNGDKQAFGELALEYRKNICGLAFRVIGDLHEAEDITQNVFIQAYLALPKFIPNHDGSFKSWLLTITSRLCIDYTRRYRKRNIFTAIHPEMIATDKSILDIIVDDEENRLLREALLRLPTHYRMVIGLKYIEELDYREIAQIMKIPIGTVGTWIHRGLAQMRVDLNKKGVDDNVELAAR
jgi:RNA polymerase sigma-70 factor, ECF subfamily